MPLTASRYFFYGTLMDAAVRRLVLGTDLPARQVRPARLAGWRRVYRRGASFPVLVADAQAAVEGLVVAPVSTAAAARLARFEGPDYRLADVRVTVRFAGPAMTMCARVFLPVTPTLGSDREWHFDAWSATERAAFLARIQTTGLART